MKQAKFRVSAPRRSQPGCSTAYCARGARRSLARDARRGDNGPIKIAGMSDEMGDQFDLAFIWQSATSDSQTARSPSVVMFRVSASVISHSFRSHCLALVRQRGARYAGFAARKSRRETAVLQEAMTTKALINPVLPEPTIL